MVLGHLAEVNQVDIYHIKDVIIGFVHILDLCISIKEKIVKFEIVINIACVMDLFQDIKNLNSK